MSDYIKFGPSGSDIGFTLAGYKSTIDMPKYLKELDVDCFEYSFGQGVRLTSEKAKQIGNVFTESGFEISVHAPYFVNFANPDEEKIIGSFRYMTDSLTALKYLGGKRCVVHPGSPLKQEREEAVSRMLDNLKRFSEHLQEKGLNDFYVCLETMGKLNQLGSVEEIIKCCNVAPNFYPCFDFGHINSRTIGGLRTQEDFDNLIKQALDGMDEYKVKNMHVHFSKIQYGKSGEIKHLTFEDTEFGPNYELMINSFVKYGLTPYVACESAGTQGNDAKTMKKYYISIIWFNIISWFLFVKKVK